MLLAATLFLSFCSYLKSCICMYLHFYLLATVDTVDADKGPALDADAARNRVQS
jgi:hypothetical protein